MSIYDERSDNKDEIIMELTCIKKLEEVQVLIDHLDLKDLFTADKFVHCNKAKTTAEMISDEEILKAVLLNNQEKETEESLLPIITYNKTIKSYEKVILYLE